MQGGYIVSQSQTFSYESDNQVLPSKRVDSPSGDTYMFTSLEQDSVGNSTKYSILAPDGHTDVYERTIEYY